MPPFFADLLERSTGGGSIASRVRDEDVDRCECLFNLTAHRLDLAEPRDVRYDMHGRSAGSLDVSPHSRQCRRIPTVQRHPCAMLCKQPGNGGADAARTSRHQGHLAVQDTHRYPAFFTRLRYISTSSFTVVASVGLLSSRTRVKRGKRMAKIGRASCRERWETGVVAVETIK